MWPSASWTTSSSVSPRIVCPHSQLICLAMISPLFGHLAAIVRCAGWRYVVRTLVSGATRIQLCGRLVAEIDGKRIHDALPGRQGRLLFGYLVANRHRSTHREALVEILWPEALPATPDATVRPLLSKLRQVLGEDRLQGRGELQLVLPDGTRVDVETANRAIHDAESAVAQERWRDAWLPARVAWSVTQREFMPGMRGPWIDERRTELED